MPEVSPGLGLERFTLVWRGDDYCSVDIVEQGVACIVLAVLPDFPLDLDADRARQLVASWRQRAELEPQSYEVRLEQRSL